MALELHLPPVHKKAAVKRIGVGLVLAAAACGGSSPARVAAPVATTVTSASPTATEPAAGGYGGAPVLAVPTRTAAPATRSPAASPKAVARQAAKPPTRAAAPQPSPTPTRTPSPKPAPSSPAAAPTTYDIQMRGLSFAPARLTLRVGDSVLVRNADTGHHTFTDSPSFDSGDLGPGQTYTYRFATAGRYDFVCSYHAASGMTGTITVN